MKKLLILICAFALSSAAFAAPAKTTPVVAHMSGVVEKYDVATKTLTVKHDGGKAITFQINDKSEVMKGKTKADVSSLATSGGQPVKVEYVMDGPNRVAEKIAVAAAHTAASKMKTGKK
jgi:hypothetical protein